jgi:hypothetical protein
VFGMGTGVTLAVCSPASLMRRLVVVFPQPSSLHTRAVFPRNESGKLAPQTCIQNELHWDRLQLQSVITLQGLLLSIL